MSSTLAEEYLNHLCLQLSSRCVGRPGNRDATDFVKKIWESFGWTTTETPFEAMDWTEEGAKLSCENERFAVQPSTYSRGCDVRGELAEADSLEMLVQNDFRGKILLLHGALAEEPLMPKNFVFYNPESHRATVRALENSGALALVTATARHSALAGGVYPFPMIEDGDFDVPSVFMTDDEGRRLARRVGSSVQLRSTARRMASTGCNVLARRPVDEVKPSAKRIVVTAHIDAKQNTPGALDNAAGIVVLLLLSEMLRDAPHAGHVVELLALNGEDYYAVPGQMSFLRENEGRFGDIALNINIDCAGYREGRTAVSSFDLPSEIQCRVESLLAQNAHFTAGIPWYQGDHSLFLQQGVPALVFASEWFLENLETQSVTHTPRDVPALVEPQRLVEIADAIRKIVE